MIKKIKIYTAGLLCIAAGLQACRNNPQDSTAALITDSTRIVSLNGAVTEVLAGLGLERNIAGTDITSTFPEAMKTRPKLGHVKNINAEGVLALRPGLVAGIRKEVSPALAAQFKAAGIKLLLVDQEYSVRGTKKLIRSLADSLQLQDRGKALISKLDGDLARLKPAGAAEAKPKVLFIYARGAGTMMVGGTGTQVDRAIALAGGRNAVTEFSDYKPLTAEALVKANPDVILLFSSGLESLGGAAGLKKVPGISQTNAGRNNRFVSMDGELLSSFGPRLGEAVMELEGKIR